MRKATKVGTVHRRHRITLSLRRRTLLLADRNSYRMCEYEFMTTDGVCKEIADSVNMAEVVGFSSATVLLGVV